MAEQSGDELLGNAWVQVSDVPKPHWLSNGHLRTGVQSSRLTIVGADVEAGVLRRLIVVARIVGTSGLLVPASNTRVRADSSTVTVLLRVEGHARRSDVSDVLS